MEYGVLQELALLPFARIQGVFGCCPRLASLERVDLAETEWRWDRPESGAILRAASKHALS